jgi:hypothetical protein
MLPKNRDGLMVVVDLLGRYRATLLFCAAISLAGAGFLIRETRRNDWSGVFLTLAMVLMICLSAVQSTFHPAFAANYSFRPFMARVREKTPPQTPVVFYRSASKAAAFYAREYLPSFQPLARPAAPPYYLLLWDDEWETLRGRKGLTEIDASETIGWDGDRRLVLVSVATNADLQLPQLIESADDGSEP